MMYAKSFITHVYLRLKHTYRICRHLARSSAPMGRHRRLDGGRSLVYTSHISHGDIRTPNVVLKHHS